jgi:hypothetical protein
MAKAKTKITDVLAIIVDALEPLEPIERQRTIQAALTLLGDTFTPMGNNKPGGDADRGNVGEGADEVIEGLSKKAGTWIKHNGISQGQLDEVFHIEDGTIEVIASDIPGKSSSQKTVNAYVLQGISTFLIGGELTFDDKSARALCTKAGFYDMKNHATYLGSKGNLFTGSKDSGWKLTNPGLKHGGDLIKELTKAAE